LQHQHNRILANLVFSPEYLSARTESTTITNRFPFPVRLCTDEHRTRAVTTYELVLIISIVSFRSLTRKSVRTAFVVLRTLKRYFLIKVKSESTIFLIYRETPHSTHLAF
jgi:hypothetical protein